MRSGNTFFSLILTRIPLFSGISIFNYELGILN
jgi:hypothetical protein